MPLNKEQIINIRDMKIEELFIPEWGDSVFIKTMTAEERDKFEELIFVKDGSKRKTEMAGLRAKLCSFVICDKDGNRLFSEQEVEALGKKNANALTRIFERAQVLAAIGDGDMESMLKNSGSVREGGSSSD